MSDVKRYIPEGYTQPASRSGTGTHMVESHYVLASDYEMLAQRCRELQIKNTNLQTRLAGMTLDRNCRKEERDALRAEVEQLRQQAARYERLRRLNPHQFAKLYQRNLAGERFDDLVDAL